MFGSALTRDGPTTKNLVDTETRPESGAVTYTYDLADRLTTTTDGQSGRKAAAR
jgi:YD repeat-containing protein